MKPNRLCLAFFAGFTCLSIVPGPASAALEDIVAPESLSGSYLAGRMADGTNDVDAALTYLDFALKQDPGNKLLTERVLLLQLAAGKIDDAVKLAEKLIITENRNPAARTALAVSAIKQGRFELALKELEDTANTPLANLTAGLLGAWAKQGLGQTDEALKTIGALTGPGWYDVFKEYHSALIADAAGRSKDAEATITRAYEGDATALRIVEAYARIKGRNGAFAEATRALEDFLKGQIDHPVMKELLSDLDRKRKPSPVATNAGSGAAEVLYGLGSAIGTDEGVGLAAAYLQLAHYLDPDLDLAVVALGDIFQSAAQCQKAIEVYRAVKTSSPVHRPIAIQTANCLDTLGQTDEAAKEIRRIVDADKTDVDAAIALGNLYRSHDRFAEAADAFTIGVDAVQASNTPDWRIYYFRGVSYERTKRWPQAESDFKRALEINPNQPQVLNYLGYSWVDMGMNLDKALDMIRMAVDLRPNDGYIVDSLGWAYYKLGRYELAVEQLERAVDLRPEDPVINDHLGDAYWKVDRKREAKFQWAHARDLKPDEADLAKILEKLKNGLDGGPRPDAPASGKAAATPSTTPVAAVNPADAAAPSKPAPSTITVQPGESLSSIAQRVYGNRELYYRIYEANKDRILDPNVIVPGTTLIIPAPDLN